MVEVYKFGGTSVGSAGRMWASGEIVLEGMRQGPLVVVVSAMTKVTDQLVELCAKAAKGERKELGAGVEALRRRHEEALAELAKDARSPWEVEAISARMRALCEELSELLGATALLGQLTMRTRDRVLATGEKLSVQLFALGLRNRGVDAVPLNADTFLETDDQFGEANPLGGLAERTIRSALSPLLAEGKVPVVTGYCGRAPDGATTTLGRGGSDLSAAVLAAALDAERVTLWSDVDGVYSADPRVVPEARVIPQLNYREAAEMSFYGAKVLHQRTMIPVLPKAIPVWSRNSMRPEVPGTVVDARFTPGSHPVKAVTAVPGQALISVEGKGMAGVPGVAARLFGALAQEGINVTMISQSSSEASICLAVPQADAEQAERALKRAFRAWMSRGEVEEIAVRGGVGLIAAVGLGMAQTPGVSARLFAALARRKINVLAIAQGSSELNISLAVEQAQVAEAVRAVHHEFGLHLMDAGEDGGRRMDLILLGFGKVGQAVARLVEARKDEIARRVGLEPRVVAVGDRSGFLLEPRGLSGEALEEAARQKNAGQPLARQEGGKLGSFGVLVRAALSYRLSRPVVVDLSDAEGSEEVFEQALARGADVVTANKKPLAGPRAGFEALWRATQASGRLVKAEATVGAGLPVVDTLDMLLATGDRLTGAQGCFSGTLGFVTARLEEGAKLSEAVSEAKERGYTEPDPAEDLAGMDVARKALILGRLSGIAPDEGCVSLTGLVPQEWIGRPWPALLAHLQGRDEALAAEVREAKERGLRWRFVATVEPGKIVVGPTLVPADSALGGLKGTDNMIVFRSDRYEARPLVISGPGAGIEVTAMAVLGDILRVAAQRS